MNVQPSDEPWNRPDDVVISARNVSKRFVVHSERATSLKERVVRRRSSSHTFDALHDLTLDIKRGSTVGLIGANGSGKSTTLKVLAGILRPSSGEVVTHGRIASLLELGAGFNAELSGRENVYLNASLLGLSRRETDALFDQILEFSELQEFIDNPVKHYSSGMYVRLGFSVAVHVDPDILLIDEVLAVGDEHFSRKCLNKIAEFQAEGRTILFVSHGLDLVERICDRVVVLDHGVAVYDGDPYFATDELRKILRTDVPDDVPDELPEGDGIQFGAVTFSDRRGGPVLTDIDPGRPLWIRVELDVAQPWLDQVDHIQTVVMGVGGIPIWSMTAEKPELPATGGHWAIDFEIAKAPQVRGRFVIAAQLVRKDGQAIAAHQTRHSFAINTAQGVGLLPLDYRVSVAAGVSA
jgi:ABC-2 type transport system ATP-binding protein